MGAALISEKNNHIKIDILSSVINPQTKEKLVQPILLISSLVCAIFTFYSTRFWLDEWTYASSNEYFTVIMALIIPIGFFILAFHFLLLSHTGFESDKSSSL